MKYTKIKKNLLLLDSNTYIVHCISKDRELGKGIAREIDKKYKIKKYLKMIKEKDLDLGTCVLVKNVFNLITKEFYYGKPTYKTLAVSLIYLREMLIYLKINKIAMPLIATGLDKLKWNKVEEIILSVFENTDIEIDVYYL